MKKKNENKWGGYDGKREWYMLSIFFFNFNKQIKGFILPIKLLFVISCFDKNIPKLVNTM